MQIQLSLDNLLQLIGIGANSFIIVLLILVDKGVFTKSFFLKMFFLLLLFIQLFVFKELNDILVLGQDFLKLEKTITLFVLLASITSVFPVLFLYVDGLIKDRPALRQVKVLVPGVLLSMIFTLEVKYVLFGIPTLPLIIGKSMVIIIIAILFTLKTRKAVKHYQERLEQHLTDVEGISLNWVNKFWIYYLSFFVGFIIDSLELINGFTGFYTLALVSILGVTFVKNYMQYHAVNESLHLDDLKESSNKSEPEIQREVLESKDLGLFNKIKQVVEEKELYLEKSLTLNDLAKELGVNYKYITQAINEGSGKSFLEFINEYRTSKAKGLLSNRDNLSIPIEDIGDLSGFKSKTTFYKYFKSHFGETPSAFRKAQ